MKMRVLECVQLAIKDTYHHIYFLQIHSSFQVSCLTPYATCEQATTWACSACNKRYVSSHLLFAYKFTFVPLQVTKSWWLSLPGTPHHIQIGFTNRHVYTTGCQDSLWLIPQKRLSRELWLRSIHTVTYTRTSSLLGDISCSVVNCLNMALNLTSAPCRVRFVSNKNSCGKPLTRKATSQIISYCYYTHIIIIIIIISARTGTENSKAAGKAVMLTATLSSKVFHDAQQCRHEH